MRCGIVCGVVVAVVALSVVEATAEEAAVAEAEGKWAYIPDKESPDEKAKRASEIIEKSKEGRWLSVPTGEDSAAVARQAELLAAKQRADAKTARETAAMAFEAKGRKEQVNKGIKETKEEQFKLQDEYDSTEHELVAARSLQESARSSSDQMRAAQQISKARQKLSTIAKEKRHMQTALEEDYQKLAKEQVIVAKEEQRDAREKAASRRAKLQEDMDKAYKEKNEAATQALLEKTAASAEKRATELKERKLMESNSYTAVERMGMESEKLQQAYSKMKADLNPIMINTKIDTLRADLAHLSSAKAKSASKEIDAKADLDTANSKYDQYDDTERAAVGKLQTGFVIQAQKKEKLEEEKTELKKAVSKAQTTIKLALNSIVSDKKKMNSMGDEVKKVGAQMAVEKKAKRDYTASMKDAQNTKKAIDDTQRSISLAKHRVDVQKASEHVATQALAAARAKEHADAGGKEQEETTDKAMASAAKRDEEAAQKATLSAQDKLKGLQKYLKDAYKKQEDAMSTVRANRDLFKKVTIVGGTRKQRTYERLQKQVESWNQKKDDAKKDLIQGKEELEDNRDTWDDKLEAVKAEQSKLVKKAKREEQSLKIDKDNEVSAKKNEKSLQDVSEKLSKKINTVNDDILDSEDKLRELTAPRKLQALARAKQAAIDAKDKLAKKKIEAHTNEHKVSAATQAVKVAQLSLRKAHNLEQDVSQQVQSQESQNKDNMKREQLAAAQLKARQERQKLEQKNRLKRNAEVLRMLMKEKSEAAVQEAEARAHTTSISATLAADRSTVARKETDLKKATHMANAAEDHMYNKGVALKKAQTMLDESKTAVTNALAAQTKAEKDAKIAAQQAEQSGDATAVQKANVKEAQDLVKTTEQNVSNKKADIQKAKLTLADAREKVVTAKEDAAYAFSKAEKARMAELVQDATDQVHKLQNSMDTLESRLTAMEAEHTDAKLKLDEQNAALKKAEEKALETKEAHLQKVHTFKETAEEMGAKAAKGQETISKMEIEVAELQKDHEEAKRRVERERRIVSEDKASAAKYSNQVDSLTNQRTEAETAAAKLAAAFKAKLEADKQKAEQENSKADQASMDATHEQEMGEAQTIKRDMGAEITLQNEIAVIKSKLAKAEEGGSDVANAEYEAASGGNTGAVRKANEVKQAEATLLKTTEQTKKLANEISKVRVDYSRAKAEYKASSKTREASSKHYMMMTGEARNKASERRMSQYLNSQDTLKSSVNRAREELVGEQRAQKTAQREIKQYTQDEKERNKAVRKLKIQVGVLAADKSNAIQLRGAEKLYTNEYTAANGKVREFASKLEKAEDKLKTAEDQHKLTKSDIKSTTSQLKHVDSKVTSLSTQITGWRKALRKLGEKIAAGRGKASRDRKLKYELAKQNAAASKVKIAMERSFDHLDYLESAVADADNAKVTDKMAVEDAKAALHLAMNADDNSSEKAKKAEANEVNIRALKQQLRLKENELAKMKSRVTVASQDEASLANLHSVQETDAKKANDWEKDFDFDLGDFNFGSERDLGESNAPGMEDKVQAQIDQLDVPKLVERSKKAMAASILEDQGKGVPKAGVEAKSEMDIAAEQKFNAQQVKIAKEEEARKMKVFEEGQEAQKRAQQKADHEESMIRGKGVASVDEAERQRITANMEAHHAVKDAQEELQDARLVLSKIKVLWENVVEGGHAQALHTLQLKKASAEKQIQLKENALTLAVRNRADIADRGMMRLADARLHAQKKLEEQLESNQAKTAATGAEVKFAEKDAEAAENSLAKTKAKPPAAWKLAYQSIISDAKADGTDKKYDPQAIRAEKFARIRARADKMTEKMKKMWNIKTEPEEAAGDDHDEVHNQELAKLHAREADAHAMDATMAAQRVSHIDAQMTVASAGEMPGLQTAMDKAKAEERAANKRAEESLAKARAASSAGGAEGQAVEARSEAKAAQEKLKADQEHAQDELQRQAAAARQASADAQKENAAEVAKAGGHATVSAPQPAAPQVDPEATKAAAMKAAATELEHQGGVNSHPHVRAIHTKSVTAIAKDTFRELIGQNKMGSTFGNEHVGHEEDEVRELED